MANLTIESLTLAMAVLDKLPKPPFLASSMFLPPDAAIKFADNGREYIGAGPAFWAQLPPGPNGFGAVTIWDLDAEGNKGNRADFFGALARVMAAAVNTQPQT